MVFLQRRWRSQLGQNLAAMSRFRYLLVHRYWNVDPAQVYSFLADGVRDLRQYLSSISQLIGQP